MNTLRIVVLLTSLLAGINSFAKEISFNQAVNKLENHNLLKSSQGKSKALFQKSKSMGSWGDPRVKIAAKNFPEGTLKRDQTPMTGIEFGISQKIPLTNKFGSIRSQYKALSKAAEHRTQDQKRAMIKDLWLKAIIMEKLNGGKSIYQENLSWIKKVLRSSKKLYSNGKISQQALLDIQIRQSEIESQLVRNRFNIKNIKNEIKYLINDDLDFSTMPWGALDTKSDLVHDEKEKYLKQKLEANRYAVKAAEKSFVPDLTVGVSYTKREDIDGNGDFISASISFPIPVSSKSHGEYGSAIKEKYSSLSTYNDYLEKRDMNINILQNNIKQMQNELEILRFKSIAFAKNSRQITFKSYGLGNTTYVELLQSEFKLQELLLKKTMLISMLKNKKVSLKYITGESLNE